MRWEEEQPFWFTKKWKARIPQGMLEGIVNKPTAEEVALLKAMSVEKEALMRSVSEEARQMLDEVLRLRRRAEKLQQKEKAAAARAAKAAKQQQQQMGE